MIKIPCRAQVLASKYFHNTSILLAPFKTNSSWFWKEFSEGIKWKIGIGECLIWKDRWLNYKPLIELVPNDWHITNEDVKVKEFFNHTNYQWNIALLKQAVPDNIIHMIRGYPIPMNQSSDQPLWHPNPLGTFSIKSTYR